MPWTVVEFDKKLDRTGFDCGSAALDDYLTKYISQDLRRGLSRAYVAVESAKIVGYYTLSSAQVACHEVPDRWAGGGPGGQAPSRTVITRLPAPLRHLYLQPIDASAREHRH